MQVVIERKDSFDGYVVTCEDGRVFEVETVTEAIELKEKLQNENKAINSDNLKYE